MKTFNVNTEVNASQLEENRSWLFSPKIQRRIALVGGTVLTYALLAFPGAWQYQGAAQESAEAAVEAATDKKVLDVTSPLSPVEILAGQLGTLGDAHGMKVTTSDGATCTVFSPEVRGIVPNSIANVIEKPTIIGADGCE